MSRRCGDLEDFNICIMFQTYDYISQFLGNVAGISFHIRVKLFRAVAPPALYERMYSVAGGLFRTLYHCLSDEIRFLIENHHDKDGKTHKR